MLNTQGRPTQAGETAPAASATFTGNRGLDVEEALLFEIGRADATGVDIDEPAPFVSRLGALERRTPIGLPGLAEPEAVRHYVRLSRRNYSIEAGVYPLGSCTMKHNPRLNEKLARLPGFADVHPLQPFSTVQGALELIETLANALIAMTGMSTVAMSP
ncbi:MAG TPA: aminomethyl-transferring glycine dehydrogenase subunit GcvPB, partial [Roseiarcus sp.]|nr:aminomethyl-transferring glycine dehydrogenase subunit GcvPB [Roseiarcus sp.]